MDWSKVPVDAPSLDEVFPKDYEDIPEPQSNITPLHDVLAEKEENLADLLTAILNRLDILESHFTPAGLDILSETLERRLVARLRLQTGRR